MYALFILATFLISFGLTARLSHLIVDDAIMQPLRDWFSKNANSRRSWNFDTNRFESPTPQRARFFAWATALVNCIHCTSVWVAAGVTAAAVLATDLSLNWFFFVAWAASLAYLTGLVATWRYAKEAY